MSEETLTSTPAASCSDVQVESLPGTAKPGSTYVLFEWPHAWTHDVLDGGTLGAELTEKLKAHLAEYDASLLLIRHPTREGRQIDDHHVYLVFAEDEATEVMHVDGPEALLELDLSGPGKNAAVGATARTKPLLLVCTHAKRDRCCAVKGRSMINKLVQKYPFGHGNDVVWETSHIKGHRFAPTMLLMPWAYSFGRMTFEATDAMLEAALHGKYFVPGNRGRGTLSAPAQAAEVAVAAELARAGEQVRYGELEVTDVAVTGDGGYVRVDRHGASYTVELARKEISGVVPSCGKPAKDGESWVPTAVTARPPRA
ncbi:sucrase ferredoxin [Corynebacterium godavarianum]|uniref:Sucrase ferredoxin n=1 Tax=Corynebacterium godavarianum TaxID=2054421 RepID=A0ABY3E133_9CORY|nr:sucrase ferredoxin [Corynebacterium godavarianum]MBL7285196.1 sucrase ferredoxin [Corynebacterium godavarianum]TSJ73308.1 sucrase ferredoxin [Corynebacterium godavarianum]